MKYILLTISIFYSTYSMTQHVSLQGSYSFRKMELVAGFTFSKEGQFEFFYSYGASDRLARGTYTIEKDTVFLHSNKKAGNDFTVVKQLKRNSPLEIRVIHQNKLLLSHVECFCLNNEEQLIFESNEEGIILPDLVSCDKLYLRHGYFVDIPTLIKDSDNENNYFEVTLNPSLQEVSFKGIDLVIKDNALTCLPNYFMPFDNIAFIKNEE